MWAPLRARGQRWSIEGGHIGKRQHCAFNEVVEDKTISYVAQCKTCDGKTAISIIIPRNVLLDKPFHITNQRAHIRMFIKDVTEYKGHKPSVNVLPKSGPVETSETCMKANDQKITIHWVKASMFIA